MYLSYFGLARSPFEIGPEPEPFFETPAHLDALWGMIYGVTENRGFISITGAAGSGKTTTLYAAVQSLGLTHQSLLWIEFVDPLLGPAGLIATLVEHLNLPAALAAEGDLGPIRNRLLRLREAGKSLVMVFDQAQDLTAGTLTLLERLARLDESGTPLFLIIFIGLPGWEAILDRPEHDALRGGLAVRVALPALTPRLARDYIEFRITAAGGRVEAVMSAGAIRALVAAGDGNPGRIHALADRALAIGLGHRHQPIGAADIRAARAAIGPPTGPATGAATAGSGRGRPRASIAAFALLVVVAGTGYALYRAHEAAPHAAAPPAPGVVRPATITATVAPGETMQLLLRRFGLPETADEVGIVQSLNPALGESDTVHAGQILRLPAAGHPGSPPTGDAP